MEADNRRTKDRTFRAQETNAPHGCGLEQHFSSRGRLERYFLSILWVRSRLERHFWSILRLRGRLEHHFSSILRLRARLEQHFPSILRLRGKLERPFRASCGSGAGSTGHFEPFAAPGQVLTTVAVIRAAKPSS